MNCPNCGSSLSLGDDQKFCHSCGVLISPDEQQNQTEMPDEAPTISLDMKYCPWEDQDEVGFFAGLYRTVRRSLTNPSDFFALLPKQGGYLAPALFALIIQSTAGIISSIWSTALDNSIFNVISASFPNLIALALLIPIGVFIAIVLMSLTLHLSLFILGGANENFEATFRVVCYSSGPDLLTIIPILGSAAAFVWRSVLVIMGLKRVHETSLAKSLLAFVLPFGFCCGLLFFVLFSAALALG